MLKYHYIYIIRCRDQTLYTGYTVDLENRIKKHNLKKGSKYTRSRTPVKLVYFERFLDKSAAMRREYEIKQFSRQQKFNLIRSQK